MIKIKMEFKRGIVSLKLKWSSKLIFIIFGLISGKNKYGRAIKRG